MTTSVTKQMIIFMALVLSATITMTLGYADIPKTVGIGQTNLTTYLPEALNVYLRAGGGLHPDSTVTDHGVVIGTITAVKPTSQGLQVDLSVDDSVKIGADAIATVQHASPVGEMSLELASTQPGGPFLTDGAVIPPAPITAQSDPSTLVYATY